VYLRPRPGTNVALLNAMAATILDEGLADEEFVHERVDGLDEYARHLVLYQPELVAPHCGVDARSIRDAARLYATRRPAMAFHGLGVTEHTQGTDGVMCIANLALLTGNLGRRGSGVNPLRGQNNVQGSAHMGCTPDRLPGYAPFAQAERYERVWRATVPARAGLDAMEMLDGAAAGALHAMWVVGWDILQTQPNMHATAQALAALDHLVVQDVFLNETARAHATVFLPACSAFEKDGTFMNGERRVQRVRTVLAPVGTSRPDWEIVGLVAAAMGHADGFTFTGADAIWDEVRSVWPAGAGMTYARLDGPGGLQWPCPTEEHPGTEVLHTTDFGPIGRRARLRVVDQQAALERTDDDFPFVLLTGRALDQFNAGTMTRRSLAQQLHPTDVLDISPPDAARLHVGDGDLVQVVSRYGAAVLPAHLSERVRAGEVFATFSDPATAVNRLTSPHRDRVTHTPEYKVTAVRLEAPFTSARG
jgi:formate dehydrogenase major subunit